ncbi:MAG: shikimate kinase [Planctomycetota bacterium]
MRLLLVGLRGSGKTEVGRELAERLHLPFYDSDAEIEARWGEGPGQIIRGQGEREFRRREAEVIAELAGRSRGVLAAGGGAPASAENRKALQAWRAILLDASDETLCSRLQASSAPDRPPLTELPLLEEIARLRELRMADYLALDPWRLSSEGISPAVAAERIALRLAAGREGAG